MNINGYKIIYVKNDKNITSVHAYVKTGSMFETKKQSGIAHLLEHVITDSWEKCKGNCTTYWGKKGIHSNAQTLMVYTRYYIVGLTKEIGDMIDYMASIITKPVFDKRTIDRSKQAVKDELLIRINGPEWKVYNTFYNSIEDDTEYNGIGRLGDYPLKIKNLETITHKDLLDYYDKWYRSDNIFFVVVSNASLDKISSYFSKFLHKRPSLAFKPVNPTISCINCTSIIHRKDAEKTSFIIGFINNKQDPFDFLYYSLIQDMLTGDVSSLLYRALRDKHKLIYGIKLLFELNKSYSLSIFEVSCQFKNAEKLMITLMTLLQQFSVGKFDSNLLKRSKERLTIMDMNNCRENTEFLNAFYANQFIMTGKIDLTPDKYIQAVNSITKAKLVKVIKRLFPFDHVLVTCETH